jgi:hypothetical protein
MRIESAVCGCCTGCFIKNDKFHWFIFLTNHGEEDEIFRAMWYIAWGFSASFHSYSPLPGFQWIFKIKLTSSHVISCHHALLLLQFRCSSMKETFTMIPSQQRQLLALSTSSRKMTVSHTGLFGWVATVPGR